MGSPTPCTPCNLRNAADCPGTPSLPFTPPARARDGPPPCYTWPMDDYRQEDAPDDKPPPVAFKRRRPTKGRRGSKGDRRAQAARYWLRNRSRRLAYFRRRRTLLQSLRSP